MCNGSLFFFCCRYTDLNPLATIYSVTITLEQRLTTPDEEETHIDTFILQTFECTPDKAASLGYLWRGIEAKQIAGDDPEIQGHSGSTKQELHLNGGPRLPSPVLGAHCTTGAVLQNVISTITHQLILETKYSTYDKDDDGAWIQSPNMVSSFKRSVTVSDCTISRPTIETPKYITTSQEVPVDPDKHLVPYTEGTVPRSFSVPKIASVIQKGKLVGKPKHHSKPSTSSQVRRHQLETNSFCLCFFEEAAKYPQPGSGLNLVDTLDLAPEWDIIEEERYVDRDRAEARDEWRQRNPQGREDVPGFLYVFMSECLCTAVEKETQVTEGRRVNPKVIYESSAM